MNWKKAGKFRMDRRVIDKSPMKLLHRIFRDIIVVHAENYFAEDVIVYTAIGDVFDEVEQGHVIPEYMIQITKYKKYYKVEWIKM